VQGAVAGKAAATTAKATAGWPGIAAPALDSANAAALAPTQTNATRPPHELMARIRALAADQAGVIRSGSGLNAAAREIAAIRSELPALGCGATADRVYNRSWIEAIECVSALTTLEAIIACALERKESRGAHFRSDHPQQDDGAFLRSGYLRRKDAVLAHEFRRVRGGSLIEASSA
jgi:succinate dehydrogenase / fumarate reductase flavoprotein subunit